MEEEIYLHLSRELNLTIEDRARLNGWEVEDGVLRPGNEEEEFGAWKPRGPRLCTAVQVFSELFEGDSDPRSLDLANYMSSGPS